MHLAEIGLQVELVDAGGDRGDVPRHEFQRLVAAEDPLGRHAQGLGGQSGLVAAGLAGRRALRHLAILLQGVFRLVEVVLERPGDQQLGLPRMLVTGIFRDHPPPLADRRFPFLLPMVHRAEQEHDLRTARIQRIPDQELRKQRGGPGIVSRVELVHRHAIFRVDDLLLHGAGGLQGRVLDQVLPPRGDRLGQIALQLVGSPQQAARLGDFLAVLVAFVLQEITERRGRLVVALAVQLALGNHQPSLAGQPMRGIPPGERLQSRNAGPQLFETFRPGQVPRLGQVERGLGDPLRFRTAVLVEKFLPGEPGPETVLRRHATFAQFLAVGG